MDQVSVAPLLPIAVDIPTTIHSRVVDMGRWSNIALGSFTFSFFLLAKNIEGGGGSFL